MTPAEIVAIMRHRGWLDTEPADAKTLINSAVRYLMLRDNIGTDTLATILDRSPEYVVRKIAAARWTTDDIDFLAETFDCEPADLLRGYRHFLKTDTT